MGDWTDTLNDRQTGKVNGYLDTDKPVADENGVPFVQDNQAPVEDVRVDAIEPTEDAGVDVVVDPPTIDTPAPTAPDDVDGETNDDGLPEGNNH